MPAGGMTVDEVYTLMKYVINKTQNGDLPPSKFNSVINVGMRSWIAWILGNFQTYQPGRPISRVELGNNSVVRQRLTPTIYGYILPIDSQGISPYPHDYLQTDTMYSFYGYKRIRYAENNQLDSYYNSTIDPIATNPIYLIEDDNFQFYPTTLWQAKLRYVRDPQDIIWGYTLDSKNRPVYNPATSTDPIFDNLTMLEIIVRALALVGVNLQLGVVMQYAEQIKQGGQ